MNKTILSTIVAITIGGLPLSAQKIDEHKDSQQKRIAQSVVSGQLTPRETKKLEAKEQAINKEVRTGRKANGGKLTQAETKLDAQTQK